LADIAVGVYLTLEILKMKCFFFGEFVLNRKLTLSGSPGFYKNENEAITRLTLPQILF